jgi:molybdopterin converting factor small subunit
MAAKIKVYGPLREYLQGQSEVSVAAGQTVRQALEGLGVNVLLVALVVVNEEARDKDYVLQEADVVRLTMVLGGG